MWLCGGLGCGVEVWQCGSVVVCDVARRMWSACSQELACLPVVSKSSPKVRHARLVVLPELRMELYRPVSEVALIGRRDAGEEVREGGG